MQQQQQQLTDAHAVADALKLQQQLSETHCRLSSGRCPEAAEAAGKILPWALSYMTDTKLVKDT